MEKRSTWNGTHRVESIFGDWIAFEELWDIDFESIASKVVGEEL
jgi:hypothetical protein